MNDEIRKEESGIEIYRTPLTHKQKIVYDFIVDYIREKGKSPTFRDIQNGLNLASSAQAHNYILHLIAKGYVRKEKKKSRSISLIYPNSKHEQISEEPEPIRQLKFTPEELERYSDYLGEDKLRFLWFTDGSRLFWVDPEQIEINNETIQKKEN